MFIDNTPYKGLYSEQSHEFHHLYQYSSGFSKTVFTNDLYEKVREGYTNENNVISTTAMVLYYTFKHEISAFSSELYQYLESNKKQYRIEELTLDILYDISPNYVNFEKNIDDFEKYIKDKKNISLIENYFDLSIGHIEKRIDNAIGLWDTYFYKVLAKYKTSRFLDTHNGVRKYGEFMGECKSQGYKCQYDIML